MKLKLTQIFTAFILFVAGGSTVFAQNDLDDKLNKIDGSIDKITITSNGQEYIFEGSDAEKLFKRMKSSKSQSFVWNSPNDKMKKKVVIVDSDGEKEIIEYNGDDEHVFIVKADDDFEWESEGLKKNVKIEIENGEKKVTVTSNENGEKTTQVYEGDEADEYLETMKSENDEFNIEIDDSNGKKVKKIIIETEKEID